MRIVVVGTSHIAVDMVELLVGRDHDIIVVESDPERIEELEETLDVSFLKGDGTQPALLRETDPEGSDVLISLTDSDQDNILACLVGRSLGFPRVIPRIDTPEFEELCHELGLDEAILPDRTAGRYLADLVEGIDTLELRTVIKGEARFFSFVARSDDESEVGNLDLPEDAAVVCLYRKESFVLADPETGVKEGDEVVILTHSRNLPELRDRWTPETAPSHGTAETSKKSSGSDDEK